MITVDNIPKLNNDFLYGLSERYMTILILPLTKEEACFCIDTNEVEHYPIQGRGENPKFENQKSKCSIPQNGNWQN